MPENIGQLPNLKKIYIYLVYHIPDKSIMKSWIFICNCMYIPYNEIRVPVASHISSTY